MVVLFCCCFVMVFIWLVLDALDLVRNTKKEFCANRICAHKGPQAANRKKRLMGCDICAILPYS